MDRRSELIKRLEALIADTEWSEIVDLSPEDARDILKLLKEQESVKVLHLRKVKAIKHEEIFFEGACGHCCSYIMKHWKACPVCGKAANWGE